MEVASGFVQSNIGDFVRFSRGSEHIEVPSLILGKSPSEYAAKVNELEERLRAEYMEKSPMIMSKGVYVRITDNGRLSYVEFAGQPVAGGYAFCQETADRYAAKIKVLPEFKAAVRNGKIVYFRHRQYTNFRNARIFLVDEINALRK